MRDYADRLVGLPSAEDGDAPLSQGISADAKEVRRMKRAAGWVRSLLRGKDFCGGAFLDERTNFFTTLETLGLGVSHNPHGDFLEHIGITWRVDRGSEVSFVVPWGHEVPWLSGWVTPRLGIGWRQPGLRLAAIKAVDLSWTRSASAFLSPYARAGVDHHVCGGTDGSRPACSRERRDVGANSLAADVPIESSDVRLPALRFAWEVGMAVRVKPAWRKAPLLGGKFGVRGNGTRDPRHIRFIFEVGTAVW